MILMYDHDCDQIVGINEQLFMYRATGPNEKGESQVVPPIKLAARPVDPDRTMLSLWVAPGLLLTSSNEASLRFWKLKSDENFVLRIEDDKVPPDDKIQAVAFCEQRRLLCAGTERGYVLFWRQCSFSEGAYEAEDWQPLLHATMKLSDGIDELKWAPAASARGLVAARMKASCYILIEHELQRKLREGCLLVQLSNRNLGFASAVRQRDDSGRALPQDELPMERDFWAGLEPRALSEMASTMPIKGCDCNATKIVMWSGTKAEVHQIDPASGQHALESSFETSASNMIISPDRPGEPTYLFLAVEHSEAKDGREGRDAHIGISNLKGYTTQSWPLGEAEGDPIHLDMLGDFLVCSTSRGYLRLWDLSKARNLSQAKPDSKLSRAFEKGEITSVRVNKDGTRVSLLARAGGGGGGGGGKAPALLPDTHLYVYDVENDVFLSHDCGPAFQPVGHAWDPSDARLLACEVRRVYEARLAETDVQVAVNKAEVCFFFATPNQGLQLQHRLGLDVDGQVLLGLHAPHLLLSAKKEVHSSALNVTAQVMRDFVGMECEDLETRRALLEFSYNMTIGNMDEAYKSVKKIKSKELWANMAHMCVKTSRLDVAEQCLSKMGFAAASRAVQDAKEREPERDAHVAMVAVQLGMLADAERLYVGCGRYDLLNKMYQASGQWYKAVDVAEKKDRIHLKVTYLLWARHLEAGGDVQAAIECYEKADAHRTEVPRMLQVFPCVRVCLCVLASFRSVRTGIPCLSAVVAVLRCASRARGGRVPAMPAVRPGGGRRQGSSKTCLNLKPETRNLNPNRKEG
jgi:intraflagellar transport protein 140